MKIGHSTTDTALHNLLYKAMNDCNTLYSTIVNKRTSITQKERDKIYTKLIQRYEYMQYLQRHYPWGLYTTNQINETDTKVQEVLQVLSTLTITTGKKKKETK